jgi:hypothetical protein
VFTVSPNTLGGDLASLQADVRTWPIPSLSLVRGTRLGAADFLFFLQGPTLSGLGGVRMENRVDAVIYLGPPSAMTTARPSAALCGDTNYVRMRIERQAAIQFALPPDDQHGTWENWFRTACGRPPAVR